MPWGIKLLEMATDVHSRGQLLLVRSKDVASPAPRTKRVMTVAGDHDFRQTLSNRKERNNEYQRFTNLRRSIAGVSRRHRLRRYLHRSDELPVFAFISGYGGHASRREVLFQSSGGAC